MTARPRLRMLLLAAAATAVSSALVVVQAGGTHGASPLVDLGPSRSAPIDRATPDATADPGPQRQHQAFTQPAAPREPESPHPEMLEPGDEGPAVRALQQRLHHLGYWLGRPDGVYGKLTRQAVLAFQSVEGLARDGVAGPQVHRALGDAARPRVNTADRGLVIDLDRQTLTLVEDGRARWVLHTSTGNGEPYTDSSGATSVATTPAGRFAVTRRIDGWRHAPLGRLYRPAYFNGGIAVHGYHDIPARPASHGCARVSMAAMDFLWREGAVDVGQPVHVH